MCVCYVCTHVLCQYICGSVYVTISVAFTHNWLYQMNVTRGEEILSKSTILK